MSEETMEVKKYHLFGGDDSYEPSPGMDGYLGLVTIEQATQLVIGKSLEWAHLARVNVEKRLAKVADYEPKSIEDVSDSRRAIVSKWNFEDGTSLEIARRWQAFQTYEPRGTSTFLVTGYINPWMDERPPSAKMPPELHFPSSDPL